MRPDGSYQLPASVTPSSRPKRDAAASGRERTRQEYRSGQRCGRREAQRRRRLRDGTPQGLSHGAVEADEERAADQRVADGYFVQVRQRPKQRQIPGIEVMTRVHPEPERVRDVRRLDVAAEAAVHRLRAFLECMCEGLCVELDAIPADRGGPFDGGPVRIHEDADADAAFPQVADNLAHVSGRRVGRPARLTRDLTGLHGDQRALMGTHFANHGEEVRPWVPFHVEFDGPAPRLEITRDRVHVGRGDVSRVGPRVHRDTGAPAARHTLTAWTTDGTDPPRELRSVATLFTLTLSRGPVASGAVIPGAL